MVREFRYPGEGSRLWSEQTSTEWHLYKADIEETQAKEDTAVLSIMAMNGGTPCAAALYTDPTRNDQDTYMLNKFIRNAGDTCKGGGAAILCHLIRNSHNGKHESSPLKMFPIPGEVGLRRYYESFGCTEPPSLFSAIMGIPKGDIPMFAGTVPLVCQDSNPKRCTPYADMVLDADGYLVNVPGHNSRRSRPMAAAGPGPAAPVQALLGVTGLRGWPPAGMLGGFLGSGILTFAVLRRFPRWGRLTADEEPLIGLAA
jgi:hypothetical protein